MKQLQKYYAENPMSLAIDDIGPYYDASEADAAFAEMRREHAEHIARIEALTIELQSSLEQKLQETKQALMREHAEEIERLKAALKHYAEPKNCEQFWIDEYYRYRKQAGRYEKLRKLTPDEFKYLRDADARGAMALDAMVDNLPGWPVGFVDQLPASGEKP